MLDKIATFKNLGVHHPLRYQVAEPVLKGLVKFSYKYLRLVVPNAKFNFEKVLGRVAELLDLKPEQVLAVGEDRDNFIFYC
jgi:hypothetical protein